MRVRTIKARDLARVDDVLTRAYATPSQLRARRAAALAPSGGVPA